MAKKTADAKHLSDASADIERTFPGATIKWDTNVSPYMISISVDGALVRAFVEPEALAERGEVYDAFTRRISELVMDSIAKAERLRSGSVKDELAKAGVRAPLSAAKVYSSRS